MSGHFLLALLSTCTLATVQTHGLPIPENMWKELSVFLDGFYDKKIILNYCFPNVQFFPWNLKRPLEMTYIKNG